MDILKAKVVIDTAADLPSEIIKKNKISVIPHIVSFENKALKLGEEISFLDYYKILDKLTEIPNTASPDPASFFNIYKESIEEQKQEYVFCVTVAEDLSATYSSANLRNSSMLMSFIDFTCIFELRLNPSAGDGHDNGKNGTDFIRCKALFLGHAKVVLHSWITAHGHSRRHVQHQSGFGF